MPRLLTIIFALAASVAAAPLGAASASTSRHSHHEKAESIKPDRRADASQHDHTSTASPVIDMMLSAPEQQALQIAAQNGDHDIIMIDKTLGRILVFHDDKPVWTGAALTGMSPLDQYTAEILGSPESHKFATEEKITPAGRFTVKRALDDEEGSVLELNEIHGRTWWLAIHRVWLGIPSEHRADRLESADPAVKHITFGCINVNAETMRYLITHLPNKDATPLYILPTNQALTSSILQMGKDEAALTAALESPRSTTKRRMRAVKRRQSASKRYADRAREQ